MFCEFRALNRRALGNDLCDRTDHMSYCAAIRPFEIPELRPRMCPTDLQNS